MKRSNIIFFTLIAVLAVLPFIIVGIFHLMPEKKLITLGDNASIIVIENPELQAKNVTIEVGEEEGEVLSIRLHTPAIRNLQTTIYYKGNRIYIPAYNEMGDTLFIGKPDDPTQNEELTLYIKSKQMKKIILNDQVLKNGTKEDSIDEYSFVPGLTEKINLFINSSISMQKQIESLNAIKLDY